MTAFIYPSDVFNRNCPDAFWDAEAQAMQSAGHDVLLVNHDDLQEQRSTRLRGKSYTEECLYRGWMLAPSQYAFLEETVVAHGHKMRVSVEEYEANHYLPGWYAQTEELTSNSVWTTNADQTEFFEALDRLNVPAVVIKDYSKSEKHYWDTAMFIPDTSDRAHAWKVASTFLNLRGEHFDQGFVVREHVPYAPSELRTWWYENTCKLVTAHPDTPDMVSELNTVPFNKVVNQLNRTFVTVDLAYRTDLCRWEIVEIGDGQVSGLPESCHPSEFAAIFG